MNWIHAYKDDYFENNGSLLEMELKFLQERNGKVVKQEIGPVTTKDLADCVMVIASELLKDQLDRHLRRERLGQARLATGAQGGYMAGRADDSPVSGNRSKVARDRLTRKGQHDRMRGRAYRR
jgi:hypothetical protein